jgi:hypothetical protein
MFFDCFYFCREELGGISIKFETQEEWEAVSNNMIDMGKNNITLTTFYIFFFLNLLIQTNS